MHPIFTSAKLVLGYLAAWLAADALLTYIGWASGGLSGTESAAIFSPTCAVFAFVCLSPWYIGRTLPPASTGLLKVVGGFVAGAAVAGAMFAGLAMAASSLLARLPSFPGIEQRLSGSGALLFGAGLLLYLVSSGLHYSALALAASRDAERRSAEARTLAREAELQALRMQLNPHFLFNSLHSIAALVTMDAARAREMCLRLAAFLRGGLGLGARESVPLREELDLARSYLEVERVRFGSRLVVEQDVEPGCEECAVPALLLQPLLENAVKHGVAGLVEGGTIRLAARRGPRSLAITIENTFDPEMPPAHSTGLGLNQVRRRLEVRYGDRAAFQAAPHGTVYRVELRLPCESSMASISRA